MTGLSIEQIIRMEIIYPDVRSWESPADGMVQWRRKAGA